MCASSCSENGLAPPPPPPWQFLNWPRGGGADDQSKIRLEVTCYRPRRLFPIGHVVPLLTNKKVQLDHAMTAVWQVQWKWSASRRGPWLISGLLPRGIDQWQSSICRGWRLLANRRGGNVGAEREGVAGPVERPRQPRFRRECGARLRPRFEQRGTRQPHLLQVSRQVILISFNFNIRKAYNTVILITVDTKC